MQSNGSFIDTDTAPHAFVNGNSSNLAESTTKEELVELETQLSDPDNGIVARVIHVSGNYVKVKWFRNGKPLGVYKSRGHSVEQALEALENFKAELPTTE